MNLETQEDQNFTDRVFKGTLPQPHNSFMSNPDPVIVDPHYPSKKEMTHNPGYLGKVHLGDASDSLFSPLHMNTESRFTPVTPGMETTVALDNSNTSTITHDIHQLNSSTVMWGHSSNGFLSPFLQRGHGGISNAAPSFFTPERNLQSKILSFVSPQPLGYDSSRSLAPDYFPPPHPRSPTSTVTGSPDDTAVLDTSSCTDDVDHSVMSTASTANVLNAGISQICLNKPPQTTPIFPHTSPRRSLPHMLSNVGEFTRRNMPRTHALRPSPRASEAQRSFFPSSQPTPASVRQGVSYPHSFTCVSSPRGAADTLHACDVSPLPPTRRASPSRTQRPYAEEAVGSRSQGGSPLLLPAPAHTLLGNSLDASYASYASGTSSAPHRGDALSVSFTANSLPLRPTHSRRVPDLASPLKATRTHHSIVGSRAQQALSHGFTHGLVYADELRADQSMLDGVDAGPCLDSDASLSTAPASISTTPAASPPQPRRALSHQQGYLRMGPAVGSAPMQRRSCVSPSHQRRGAHVSASSDTPVDVDDSVLHVRVPAPSDDSCPPTLHTSVLNTSLAESGRGPVQRKRGLSADLMTPTHTPSQGPYVPLGGSARAGVRLVCRAAAEEDAPVGAGASPTHSRARRDQIVRPHSSHVHSHPVTLPRAFPSGYTNAPPHRQGLFMRAFRSRDHLADVSTPFPPAVPYADNPIFAREHAQALRMREPASPQSLRSVDARTDMASCASPPRSGGTAPAPLEPSAVMAAFAGMSPEEQLMLARQLTTRPLPTSAHTGSSTDAFPIHNFDDERGVYPPVPVPHFGEEPAHAAMPRFGAALPPLILPDAAAEDAEDADADAAHGRAASHSSSDHHFSLVASSDTVHDHQHLSSPTHLHKRVHLNCTTTPSRAPWGKSRHARHRSEMVDAAGAPTLDTVLFSAPAAPQSRSASPAHGAEGRDAHGLERVPLSTRSLPATAHCPANSPSLDCAASPSLSSVGGTRTPLDSGALFLACLPIPYTARVAAPSEVDEPPRAPPRMAAAVCTGTHTASDSADLRPNDLSGASDASDPRWFRIALRAPAVLPSEYTCDTADHLHIALDAHTASDHATLSTRSTVPATPPPALSDCRKTDASDGPQRTATAPPVLSSAGVAPALNAATAAAAAAVAAATPIPSSASLPFDLLSAARNALPDVRHMVPAASPAHRLPLNTSGASYASSPAPGLTLPCPPSLAQHSLAMHSLAMHDANMNTLLVPPRPTPLPPRTASRTANAATLATPCPTLFRAPPCALMPSSAHHASTTNTPRSPPHTQQSTTFTPPAAPTPAHLPTTALPRPLLATRNADIADQHLPRPANDVAAPVRSTASSGEARHVPVKLMFDGISDGSDLQSRSSHGDVPRALFFGSDSEEGAAADQATLANTQSNSRLDSVTPFAVPPFATAAAAAATPKKAPIASPCRGASLPRAYAAPSSACKAGKHRPHSSNHSSHSLDDDDDDADAQPSVFGCVKDVVFQYGDAFFAKDSFIDDESPAQPQSRAISRTPYARVASPALPRTARAARGMSVSVRSDSDASDAEAPAGDAHEAMSSDMPADTAAQSAPPRDRASSPPSPPSPPSDEPIAFLAHEVRGVGGAARAQGVCRAFFRSPGKSAASPARESSAAVAHKLDFGNTDGATLPKPALPVPSSAVRASRALSGIGMLPLPAPTPAPADLSSASLPRPVLRMQPASADTTATTDDEACLRTPTAPPHASFTSSAQQPLRPTLGFLSPDPAAFNTNTIPSSGRPTPQFGLTSPHPIGLRSHVKAARYMPPPTPDRGIPKLHRQKSFSETRLLLTFDKDDMHRRYFSLDLFTNLVMVGHGAFFDVFKCERNGQVRAIKRSKKPFRGKAERDDLLREMRCVSQLGHAHPNVMKYYTAWQEDSHLHIEVEYCRSNLYAYIAAMEVEYGVAATDISVSGNGRVDTCSPWNGVLLNVAYQVASGLAHVHAHHVLHLDVKPDNVLVNDKGEIKLADFGNAMFFDSERSRHKFLTEGDCVYMAPELLNMDSQHRTSCTAPAVRLPELIRTMRIAADGTICTDARMHETVMAHCPPRRVLSHSSYEYLSPSQTHRHLAQRTPTLSLSRAHAAGLATPALSPLLHGASLHSRCAGDSSPSPFSFSPSTSSSHAFSVPCPPPAPSIPTAVDMFSLGVLLLEIATGFAMPKEGEQWVRLRRGDFAMVRAAIENSVYTRRVSVSPLCAVHGRPAVEEGAALLSPAIGLALTAHGTRAKKSASVDSSDDYRFLAHGVAHSYAAHGPGNAHQRPGSAPNGGTCSCPSARAQRRVSPALELLIVALLNPDPALRPSAQEVVDYVDALTAMMSAHHKQQRHSHRAQEHPQDAARAGTESSGPRDMYTSSVFTFDAPTNSTEPMLSARNPHTAQPPLAAHDPLASSLPSDGAVPLPVLDIPNSRPVPVPSLVTSDALDAMDDTLVLSSTSLVSSAALDASKDGFTLPADNCGTSASPLAMNAADARAPPVLALDLSQLPPPSRVTDVSLLGDDAAHASLCSSADAMDLCSPLHAHALLPSATHMHRSAHAHAHSPYVAKPALGHAPSFYGAEAMPSARCSVVFPELQRKASMDVAIAVLHKAIDIGIGSFTARASDATAQYPLPPTAFPPFSARPHSLSRTPAFGAIAGTPNTTASSSSSTPNVMPRTDANPPALAARSPSLYGHAALPQLNPGVHGVARMQSVALDTRNLSVARCGHVPAAQTTQEQDTPLSPPSAPPASASGPCSPVTRMCVMGAGGRPVSSRFMPGPAVSAAIAAATAHEASSRAEQDAMEDGSELVPLTVAEEQACNSHFSLPRIPPLCLLPHEQGNMQGGTHVFATQAPTEVLALAPQSTNSAPPQVTLLPPQVTLLPPQVALFNLTLRTDAPTPRHARPTRPQSYAEMAAAEGAPALDTSTLGPLPPSRPPVSVTVPSADDAPRSLVSCDSAGTMGGSTPLPIYAVRHLYTDAADASARPLAAPSPLLMTVHDKSLFSPSAHHNPHISYSARTPGGAPPPAEASTSLFGFGASRALSYDAETPRGDSQLASLAPYGDHHTPRTHADLPPRSTSQGNSVHVNINGSSFNIQPFAPGAPALTQPPLQPSLSGACASSYGSAAPPLAVVPPRDMPVRQTRPQSACDSEDSGSSRISQRAPFAARLRDASVSSTHTHAFTSVNVPLLAQLAQRSGSSVFASRVHSGEFSPVLLSHALSAQMGPPVSAMGVSVPAVASGTSEGASAGSAASGNGASDHSTTVRRSKAKTSTIFHFDIAPRAPAAAPVSSVEAVEAMQQDTQETMHDASPAAHAPDNPPAPSSPVKGECESTAPAESQTLTRASSGARLPLRPSALGRGQPCALSLDGDAARASGCSWDLDTTTPPTSCSNQRARAPVVPHTATFLSSSNGVKRPLGTHPVSAAAHPLTHKTSPRHRALAVPSPRCANALVTKPDAAAAGAAGGKGNVVGDPADALLDCPPADARALCALSTLFPPRDEDHTPRARQGSLFSGAFLPLLPLATGATGGVAEDARHAHAGSRRSRVVSDCDAHLPLSFQRTLSTLHEDNASPSHLAALKLGVDVEEEDDRLDMTVCHVDDDADADAQDRTCMSPRGEGAAGRSKAVGETEGWKRGFECLTQILGSSDSVAPLSPKKPRKGVDASAGAVVRLGGPDV